NRRRGHASGRAGTDFWMPNALVNLVLERTFSGESRRLLKTLLGQNRAYSTGASLLAILRREEGQVTVRCKPPDVAPDYNQPLSDRCNPL
ncbi:MAG: hypothetical protein ACWGMZ_07070, partial [Thermoguttaceae bacterium]